MPQWQGQALRRRLGMAERQPKAPHARRRGSRWDMKQAPVLYKIA
eukprot:CAMPEP_0197889758 /NCGR_PEP_ID=MMETSP1439-20131203/24505_1 /TAXON_ID=66791 /ORGANISM="Gonyaulax spinifera, Strain CCMP409" /LENGTH=44 /DNA_ID= /DNA_START= /DNA_END= /DNA_ORIENTATION=